MTNITILRRIRPINGPRTKLIAEKWIMFIKNRTFVTSFEIHQNLSKS